MRVVMASPVVQSSGIAEQNRFTIPLTGKIFDDIVDKRYSDKPRAIQRELATNGLDSHKAAGIPDRPIKIHHPTKFAPHFSVRDFGTGMTHEQVMTLYTQVGVSS